MCVLASVYARHEARLSLLWEKKGVEVRLEDECFWGGGDQQERRLVKWQQWCGDEN